MTKKKAKTEKAPKPEFVDIFHRIFEIEWAENTPLGSRYMGLGDHGPQKIVMCSSYPPETEVQTMFHELVHQYLYSCGFDDLSSNEQLVECIANGLVGTIYTPGFLEYLIHNRDTRGK